MHSPTPSSRLILLIKNMGMDNPTIPPTFSSEPNEFQHVPHGDFGVVLDVAHVSLDKSRSIKQKELLSSFDAFDLVRRAKFYHMTYISVKNWKKIWNSENKFLLGILNSFVSARKLLHWQYYALPVQRPGRTGRWAPRRVGCPSGWRLSGHEDQTGCPAEVVFLDKI